ncbi:MAG: hypothetical protein QOI59_6668, partial [Gammaproteobacteria bacterium]|nr:hypothetical protein [Gammaproteobacteria bacterium]
MSVRRTIPRAVLLLASAGVLCTCVSEPGVAAAAARTTATEGMVTRQDLEIVDCLLPGV